MRNRCPARASRSRCPGTCRSSCRTRSSGHKTGSGGLRAERARRRGRVHLVECRAPSRRVEGRLDSGIGLAVVPGFSDSKAASGAEGVSSHFADRSQASMLRAAFAPCPRRRRWSARREPCPRRRRDRGVRSSCGRRPRRLGPRRAPRARMRRRRRRRSARWRGSAYRHRSFPAHRSGGLAVSSTVIRSTTMRPGSTR